MKVLAIESATAYASVAVVDGEPIFLQTWLAGRNHSRSVARVIEAGLKQVGLRPSDLNAIAVGIGPGSYTGIRIGMALAKGMALGADRPLVGVSTLLSLAWGCGAWKGTICPLVSAGSGHVAIGLFRGPWPVENTGDEQSLASDDAKGLIPFGALICGPGAKEIVAPESCYRAPAMADQPSAASVAGIAENYLIAGGADQLYTVEPNYLRRSAAEERMRELELRV